MHGQLPSLVRGLVPHEQRQAGGWDWRRIRNKGDRHIQMRIEDDNGRSHTIKIPNSLYLPELRLCLLSPQHWAQEAKAMGNKREWKTNKTWMENHWDKCVLFWAGGKFQRSIPHSPSTNTPSFYSAPSSKTYRAFAATFEACEASFFRKEGATRPHRICC